MFLIKFNKKEVTHIDNLENKISGAIYGFAIGDAMGGTTEFMHPHEIKAKYGTVKEIIGGGWLDLKPGEITDDTQMTLCIMDAIIKAYNSDEFHWQVFGYYVKDNFIKWYNSNPKDIGNVCRKGILEIINDKELPHNKNLLGNGSLMRALPLALMGPEFEDWNTYQGRLTHNNIKCSIIIQDYSRLIYGYINGNIYISNKNTIQRLLEPSGHIMNTYNNAIYWSNKKTFKEAIIGAVNHGGDADTIAAIAGSIAGAKHGYGNIPENWINTLDKDIKILLNKFINFINKYVQVN